MVMFRGGSRTAATSKVEAVNYYHKVLYLGIFSSPRSASDVHFLFFRPEISFFGKFGLKIQNCFLKIELGVHINSNKRNSMEMFTFCILDRKCSFWASLVQKFKIVCLK